MPEARRPIRAPQALAGGAFLLILSVFALWLVKDLEAGTLDAVGAAMLPRWLAYGIGLCGIALIFAGFMTDGASLGRWHLGPSVFLVLSILVFAVTIRPFPIGDVTTPGLGLIVAGPLSMIIAGFAMKDRRLLELIAMAFGLTGFCILLFGDLLNLPIPVYPLAWAELFPSGWSYKAIMRITVGVLAVLSIVAVFAARGSRAAVAAAPHPTRGES